MRYHCGKTRRYSREIDELQAEIDGRFPSVEYSEAEERFIASELRRLATIHGYYSDPLDADIITETKD